MNSFNKNQVKEIRNRVNEALEDLGQELGLDFKATHGKYTDHSIEFKLVIGTVSEDGNIMTPEAEAFKANAKLYGLDPDDLFTEIVWHGEKRTIIGLATRNRKYPIILQAPDGKQYKAAEKSVAFAITRSKL